jgi:hypothetical protein
LASGKRGFVAQYENVEGIAILSAGSRKELKIVGECHSFGHYLGEFYPPALFIQLVFVPTAARRLDDYLYRLRVGFLLAVLLSFLHWNLGHFKPQAAMSR